MRSRLFLLAALLVAGCSGSSADNVTPPAASATTSTLPTSTAAPTAATAAPTTAAPTTTASPTTTTVDLPKAFQDLMTRHDRAVTDVLADPRVASDPTNPKVVAFLLLFPPNSAFIAGSLKNWIAEGDKGRFYKPNKGMTISTTTVQTVTASTATEATFTVCSVNSYSVVDSAGTMIESDAGVTGGTVTAVNVEGRAKMLLEYLPLISGDAKTGKKLDSK